MRNYYSILCVDYGCTENDIRKAFRKHAKRIHPDVSKNEVFANKKFILLKEAYEILINPETRKQYDLIFRSILEKVDQFDYRKFLKNRKNNPESISKLICYDLLHCREADALELYDKMTEQGIFNFKEHVDREDFMDFSFLLAEEYLKANCIVKGYYILKGLAELEEEKPYFKHFYVEVLDKLYSICKNNIPEDDSNLIRLRFLYEVTQFDLEKKEKAHLYKLMSEIYNKNGDFDTAVKYLYKAYEVYPKLPGLKEAVEAVANFSDYSTY